MNLDIDLTGLVLPERVEIAEMSEDGRSAAFVLEPLERGFGHTLGNSVRRVLLSSLQGSAVWAFRIDGVVHEHQTISSVVEDVHQIIQNLKSLVVSLDDDVAEAILSIRASKRGPVTAKQIRAPGSVTIHDPGHHILTLEDDREINIELRVNKGRGFVLADQQKVPSDAPVDLVCIDAIYNPVLRANFTVEETRVEQRTDFDRLTIHVETDGSVDPDGAIRYAVELVRRHLEYMLYFAQGGPPREEESDRLPVPEKLAELFRTSVEDLTELSVRSRNSLQRKSIKTLGDLISQTEAEMLNIEHFGKKSLSEIYEILDQHGLRFGIRTEEDKDGKLFFLKQEAATRAGE
ncbi:MAG: DNA-directed RNA polymerase subunit alpha [Gemmatimonadetes bacterium]|nr:DNA-directed RNA polymerase subunit alpha [Gemmatimonadota bacterium]